MNNAFPQFPDSLEIQPLQRAADVALVMPGSKSITNRALILAALSSQPCEIRGALRSEDTGFMIEGLRLLGFQVVESDNGPLSILRITSEQGKELIPAREADIFVGNSGTTMRFLTALASLGHGRYRLDGDPRMRQRPMLDLLQALCQLGVRAYSEKDSGCPPVVVEADGIAGGRTSVKGDSSSQFLSGLLMVAPKARAEVTIEVEGALVSEPYVDMTLAMLRQCCVQVHSDSRTRFRVPPNQVYDLSRFEVETDASAASYFFAAAAITGGRVRISNIRSPSLQGDLRFVDVLEELGCAVVRDEGGILVQGRDLRGVEVDMNDISDCVMTLAAVACFAEGRTTIRNVAHVRHKESDRLNALATELRRVGVEVSQFSDGLAISPRPLHGAAIETYQDHRIAMAMSLIGLRVPGIVIRNPGCVAKTFPEFFSTLEQLRVP